MTEKPQSSAQRKFRSAARIAARHLPAHLPPVWFLTDPERTPNPDAIAAHLPGGWGVIYRHFGHDARIAEARKLSKVAAARRLTLLIAADPELALAVGAQGVHWPNAQVNNSVMWRDRFKVMTASAHTPMELRRLRTLRIDAALVSTVFASRSPSATHPIGPIKLRRYANSSALPIYGLGGVSAQNAGQICQTTGLASIDGILEAFEARTFRT